MPSLSSEMMALSELTSSQDTMLIVSNSDELSYASIISYRSVSALLSQAKNSKFRNSERRGAITILCRAAIQATQIANETKYY